MLQRRNCILVSPAKVIFCRSSSRNLNLVESCKIGNLVYIILLIQDLTLIFFVWLYDYNISILWLAIQSSILFYIMISCTFGPFVCVKNRLLKRSSASNPSLVSFWSCTCRLHTMALNLTGQWRNIYDKHFNTTMYRKDVHWVIYQIWQFYT